MWNPNVPQTAWDAAFAAYVKAEFSPETQKQMVENATDPSDGE